jgi:hypothetical protein
MAKSSVVNSCLIIARERYCFQVRRILTGESPYHRFDRWNWPLSTTLAADTANAGTLKANQGVRIVGEECGVKFFFGNLCAKLRTEGTFAAPRTVKINIYPNKATSTPILQKSEAWGVSFYNSLIMPRN